MISAEEVKDILTETFSDGEVQVVDMTGTSDHFEVLVIWKGFEGKSLIEQHQMINRALKERIDDGSVHALKIKTMTQKPDAAQGGASGFNILN